jgi:hypothetical protein
LRGARGSPFRSLTGILLKRSVFEIAALQRREMFTQFLNASALYQKASARLDFRQANDDGGFSQLIGMIYLRKKI